MDPRRILFFGPLGPPHGGWSHVCHSTASLLERKGLRVDSVQSLVTFKPSGRDALWKKSLRGLGSLRRLRSRIRQQLPDVALVATGPSMSFLRDLLAMRLLRQHGIPLIVRLFGGNFDKWLDDRPKSVRELVWRCLGRWTNATLVETTRLRTSLISKGLQEVRWVPNFPHADLVRMTSGERYENGPLRIVYVGRLHSSKGLDTLIETLRRARKIAWETELIGPTWLEARTTEDIAEELDSLRGPCHVTGALPPDEVYGRLARAHVLLYPTEDEREGQPGAVIEAMAHGVVPVVTPSGGLAEMLATGSGMLGFPAGGAAAAAQILTELASDREKLRDLGLAAQCRARREFSAEIAWNVIDSLLHPAVNV